MSNLSLLRSSTGLAVAAVLSGVGLAAAQNFEGTPSEIEARLAGEPFQLVAMEDNRWQGDRTQRVALQFSDGTSMRVKWARSARGGFAINNQPRYEIAAYAFQKLLLDEDEWVVPPTVMRELPLRVYRQIDPEIAPTFEGTESVLVAVQYWLNDVETVERPDLDRAAGDSAYARRLATLNLFTYLIRHVDSNPGNILISTRGEPRMFAVDNGVAFRSPESPRGTVWKMLHLDRLPASAVARLRALTRAELNAALAVVAQFRLLENGRLEAVELSPKRDPNRGVAREGDIVQFGLTNLELDEIWARRQALLERIDLGEIGIF